MHGINFMLDPENSVTDLIFHGYNTGIVGVQDLVPADLQYGEMIFFDDEQVATMDAQVVNDSARPSGGDLQPGQGRGRVIIGR